MEVYTAAQSIASLVRPGTTKENMVGMIMTKCEPFGIKANPADPTNAALMSFRNSMAQVVEDMYKALMPQIDVAQIQAIIQPLQRVVEMPGAAVKGSKKKRQPNGYSMFRHELKGTKMPAETISKMWADVPAEKKKEYTVMGKSFVPETKIPRVRKSTGYNMFFAEHSAKIAANWKLMTPEQIAAYAVKAKAVEDRQGKKVLTAFNVFMQENALPKGSWGLVSTEEKARYEALAVTANTTKAEIVVEPVEVSAVPAKREPTKYNKFVSQYKIDHPIVAGSVATKKDVAGAANGAWNALSKDEKAAWVPK
jgi:hypothetical protein